MSEREVFGALTAHLELNKGEILTIVTLRCFNESGGAPIIVKGEY